MLLPTTLHIEIIRDFFFKPPQAGQAYPRFRRTGLWVCIRVFLLMSGSRYLNSDPRSTSTGILPQVFDHEFPTVAACHGCAAARRSLSVSMSLNSAGVKLHPSRKNSCLFPHSIRPLKVSIIGPGLLEKSP